jgi:hypothetical protein
MVKVKSNPPAGSGSLCDCDTSRFPHFLENGSEVVPALNLWKDYCVNPRNLVPLKELGKLKITATSFGIKPMTSDVCYNKFLMSTL